MRFLLITTLLLSFYASFSQAHISSDSTWKRDEYKGLNFIKGIRLELGFNRLMNNPTEYNTRFWPSKGVNIGYYCIIPLVSKMLSLSPGLNLGLDNYSFERRNTRLIPTQDTVYTFLVDVPDHNYQKSKLALTYLDVPVELIFRSKLNTSKVFKIAIGGKVGILLKSHTKVKYEANGVTTRDKISTDFHINRWRYGLTARVGYGLWSVFGYYQLNNLFKEGYAPDMTPVLVGLAWSIH
ncbi:MAG: porin family protein [Cytophagaceae bacterium]